MLEEISLEADRAAQIIRRLRRMVQKREPVRTSIDLNQTIDEACLLSQQDLKQHAVRLVHDRDRSLPRILADEIQIQQVVVNLLRNAVEAMRDTAEDRRVSRSDNEPPHSGNGLRPCQRRGLRDRGGQPGAGF